MNFAPWPSFEDDEIQAAVNVLKSGNVNQWTGKEVVSFEKEFSRYIGSEYAIALANGSLALDLALMAFDIGKGDEVIVTPRSFIASASCVALKEATPVFVDIDPVSQNITLENISKAVNSRTKAVIAVNLAGWPCELNQIQLFCKKKGIALIEDCAQSHGAAYKGKKAGSFGDCAVFSFCQDKIMTTGGEGGMFLTNSKNIWEKVWAYKDHGKDFDTVFHKNQKTGFKWFVKSLGTNCRMTEMQAAMGRVMLKKLDKWVEKRRGFAELFNREFNKIPGLRTTIPGKGVYHAYYKYYVFLNLDELKASWSRGRIIESLNKSGIPCNTGICPEIYREKTFESGLYNMYGALNTDGDIYLPVARQLGETSIMFVVHPTLDMKSIQYVVEEVKAVMSKAIQ